MLERRGFLKGLVAAVAAPAVIRTPGLLMPVRTIAPIGYTVLPWSPAQYVADDYFLIWGGRCDWNSLIQRAA